MEIMNDEWVRTEMRWLYFIYKWHFNIHLERLAQLTKTSVITLNTIFQVLEQYFLTRLITCLPQSLPCSTRGGDVMWFLSALLGNFRRLTYSRANLFKIITNNYPAISHQVVWCNVHIVDFHFECTLLHMFNLFIYKYS